MRISATDKYVAAANNHGVCSLRGDSKAGNIARAQIVDALRELSESPDRGRAAILELTNHPDEWVKIWASTHLLPLAAKQALSTLERLAMGSTSLVAFNAQMVLQEWRAGRLTSP